jgi:hypothetical protein
MTSRRLVAITTLLCLGAFAAPAAAGLPAAGSQWLASDHNTPGDGWHIEATVGRDARFLREVVMYSERCNAAVVSAHVRIDADGTVAATKPFRQGHGTWRIDARFTDDGDFSGEFQVLKPGCDGGVRRFTAHGGGHDHEGHGGYGTPLGTYPDLSKGSRRAIAQARGLWQRSIRQAKRRFPTYRAALRLGYVRFPGAWPRPVLFHVRRSAFTADGRYLDARRPESLVYWWPEQGEPVLVALMYRMPNNGVWPAFAKPLLGWHWHPNRVTGKAGSTAMTHVWMTGTLRSAIANCMPVPELERANPRFRFAPPAYPFSAGSAPCPAETSGTP